LDSAGAVADGWMRAAKDVFNVVAAFIVLVNHANDDIEDKRGCYIVCEASVEPGWEEGDREVSAVEGQCLIY
jgi:hypothetical protein